ncbi:uncharacterized protein LOC114175038 [Vigna unguiculata]|uniref:uncharacterized protein LOC114175038 n=1 Tax=Vigna unguiculata TaxID=3917 RepID=UPI0010167252|nr:uncharacterized protein LOC114175038 [Vigna unguiculata]
MSNLAKLEFAALDISGDNYLSWILDAEIHLDAMGLGDAIKEGNKASEQDKAKAMIFLRRHLHEGLKIEYLTIKDPSVLWKNLKERYDHQKTVILPKARYDWMHLRLQDFKTALIENIRTQHDDGTATVLSVVLEATKIVEIKAKLENSETVETLTPPTSGIDPLPPCMATLSTEHSKGRSDVWGHFTKQKPYSEKKAKCNYCGDLIKYWLEQVG